MMQSNPADVDLVRRSKLFNANWYRAQYPTVVALDMDPAEHYVLYGARLGYRPSPEFDSDEYLDAYPEAVANGDNPLLHAVRNGDGGVLLEGPYFGPVLQNIVETARRAKQLPSNPRLAEQYELVRANFDYLHYLHSYPDIARGVSNNASFDPVCHFLEHGARERRNPSPGFDMRSYVQRYPDSAADGLNPYYHFLTVGRQQRHGSSALSAGVPAFDAMCTLTGNEPDAVESTLAERREDLRRRFEYGVLGTMIAKAAQLEPLIAPAWREISIPKLAPFHSPDIVDKVVAAHKLHEAAGFRRARIVILVPDGRWGGGPRMEGHIARVLSTVFDPDDILVLRSDRPDDIYPGRFPEGCRHVDFARICEDLAWPAKQRMLADFLRALNAQHVFNINSRLFWDLQLPYGKALSSMMSIYNCMFCNDQNVFGHWGGYPAKFFYRYFDVSAAVVTDSHYLHDALIEQFCVPPSEQDRIVTLEAPVDGTLPLQDFESLRTATGGRPQVFWAGRFDRQKRMDILFAIARRLPDVDFRVWGEPVMDSGFSRKSAPDNIVFEGVYRNFRELPLADADLWLYTAEWDGVPSMLLEVAMTGVPLVGALVGGTGEVLLEGLSEGVDPFDSVDKFVAAIERVLADPAAARKRGAALRERLLATRTPQNYLKAIRSFLPEQGL